MAAGPLPFYTFWRGVVCFYVQNGFVSATDDKRCRFLLNKRSV